jgi:hypothetical protein
MVMVRVGFPRRGGDPAGAGGQVHDLGERIAVAFDRRPGVGVPVLVVAGHCRIGRRHVTLAEVLQRETP